MTVQIFNFFNRHPLTCNTVVYLFACDLCIKMKTAVNIPVEVFVCWVHEPVVEWTMRHISFYISLNYEI